MYSQSILTTSLLALLSGSAIAQGQYGAVPNQSMTPESSKSSAAAGYTASSTSSMIPYSSIASGSATPTSSGLYSSTPSTLSSSMKPTSSTASSSAGMLGGLLNDKKLSLRAEPGSVDDFTRMIPAGEYHLPASQPAAYPTH